MKRFLLKSLSFLFYLPIILPSILISQQPKISIDAGDYQYINWDKTQTTQLNGTVSSKDLKTE